MKLKKALNSIFLFIASGVFAQDKLQVDTGELGWQIPQMGDIITFMIRLFFVIAGVAALLYLLLGAFSWITSGGNKENVEKARDKIQAAIVGIILIIIVVAILATFEKIVFGGKLCFGLTCDISIPSLIQ
jgi:hypothetical protein